MVTHDRGRGRRVSVHPTHSTLSVPSADAGEDDGNFTCAPENVAADAVVIHVLDGGGTQAAAAAAVGGGSGGGGQEDGGSAASSANDLAASGAEFNGSEMVVCALMLILLSRM